MKILNLTIIMASTILLTACVPGSDSTALKATSTAKNTNTGGTPIPTINSTESGVALKTFNQYNQTLSKATDTDSATPAIATEYELIKNSLPSDHGAGSFTSFHQISQTRLSFAYCNYFIDNNAEFKAINYLSATPQDMTTKLLVKFVGVRPATKYELYDQYNTTILKIMNNDAGVDENDAPIGDLIPTATGALLMKNLTKLACTAILSSTEFTTL
ncbi:MAG: hypothetical protein K2Q18_19565 [Bdellovibrionales bacterium]|nr:hypothetical protein [Bdellovibrionales bacterium]